MFFKNRFFFKKLKPFSFQYLIGAAASFKDPSCRCVQHESLNRFVVSASSRSGLRALVADGLNDFVSGVETVPVPGYCVVSGGEDECIFSVLEVIESDCPKNRCRRARERSTADNQMSASSPAGTVGSLGVFLSAMSEIGAACETDRSTAVSEFRPKLVPEDAC